MADDDTPINVLIVGLDEAAGKASRELLSSDALHRYHVEEAADGTLALELAKRADFDCLLVEQYLPDMDGLDFAARLSGAGRAFVGSVLLIIDEGEEALAARAMRLGVRDLIERRALSGELLLRAVRAAADRAALSRALMETRLELLHMAFHDPLTGLANRGIYFQGLEHAIAVARRSGARVGVVLADLNGFKTINSDYGLAAGDAMLKALAERMKSLLRRADTVARIGGDEFAVIMETGANDDGAVELGRKLFETLTEPVEHEGQSLEVGASIGLALFPDHADDAEELNRRAASAMSRAKREGGGVLMAVTPAGAAGSL